MRLQTTTPTTATCFISTLFWYQPMCQWFTNDALGTVGVGANSIGTLAEGAWVILFLQNSSNGLFTPLNPYDIWPISTQSTIWWMTHQKWCIFRFQDAQEFRWLNVVLLYFDRCDYGTHPFLWSLQATNISPPKVCLKMIFCSSRCNIPCKGTFSCTCINVVGLYLL